jgi:beta-phosphoglucomutase-like phosphatase (HAD superfamily)
MCARLKVSPHETLFGDDMPEGVADGKRAGTKTVLYAPNDYPHAHVADHHVSDLRQILQFID